MKQVIMLHNPRCSKSRQTLALLHDRGIEPVVIEYLKNPLSVIELKDLARKLGQVSPIEMMRTKEPEFKTLKDNHETLTDEQLFAAMADTPKLMERPVVINNNKAAIGRPPENVLGIL
ncbi:arsenate reductase (glutaredoxin) [Aestuariibacter sp. A3R04]|uniref:arsenate reductase (glutaredoxin) n=1 Tax=Aestuariibacter sp. A3R04 TaxID=2841571 RepID=UPI001C0A3DF7|nr:arsenate reductase (glutaredoxin) [Aestuariibacter sp. A3R04]MBU3022795.1 arsenate reductase (glutaredoxin) [Aestuariibacter sp. A3R04]